MSAHCSDGLGEVCERKAEEDGDTQVQGPSISKPPPGSCFPSSDIVVLLYLWCDHTLRRSSGMKEKIHPRERDHGVHAIGRYI